MPMHEKVIDLHGYKVSEAIEAFVDFYNDAIDNNDFSDIRVIHGYGSSGVGGEIRIRLRRFLESHSDCLSCSYGEEAFGNEGETLVFPRSQLQSKRDELHEKILEYCSIPKTKEKIIGKFFRYGEPKIVESLHDLEKQKMLILVSKGQHKLYSKPDT